MLGGAEPRAGRIGTETPLCVASPARNLTEERGPSAPPNTELRIAGWTLEKLSDEVERLMSDD